MVIRFPDIAIVLYVFNHMADGLSPWHEWVWFELVWWEKWVVAIFAVPLIGLCTIMQSNQFWCVGGGVEDFQAS